MRYILYIHSLSSANYWSNDYHYKLVVWPLRPPSRRYIIVIVIDIDIVSLLLSLVSSSLLSSIVSLGVIVIYYCSGCILFIYVFISSLLLLRVLLFLGSLSFSSLFLILISLPLFFRFYAHNAIEKIQSNAARRERTQRGFSCMRTGMWYSTTITLMFIIKYRAVVN